jgi:hypothetical protein
MIDDRRMMSDERQNTSMRFGAFVGAVFAMLVVAQSVGAKETLVLLDGKRVEVDVQSIDAATGKIAAAGLEQPLELQGLRSLSRPAVEVKRTPGAYAVRLAGGGDLLLETLKVADEKIAVTSAYGEAALPLEAARALVFASDNKAEKRATITEQGNEMLARALAQPPSERDALLIVVEDKVQSLSGLVSAWNPGGVTFDWEGQSREIAYERIYAVVLAQLGPAHDATGECSVATTDGSTITGRVAGLADGKLAVTLAEGAQLSIPWDAVRNISIKSDRLVYLSDSKPLDAQTRPVVTLPRPWQADKGVMGSALKLGGQTFDKGLGVMSRTELVFAQPGGFDALAATIGIDASAEGRGNCEFVVLVDGREAFRATMTGKTPPKEIRVSTAGANRVSLIVEPGGDLDLADHADWCDARFLKSEKK